MRTLAIACALLAFCVLAAEALAARSGKRQLWGAIAYDTKTGVYGYAVDMKSKRDAETEAFRLCGGDCDLIKSFRDACGAVAARPKRVSWETGASRAIAERKALAKCGGDACKIAVWACTTEK
jgi:hypothetical protein